MRGEMLHLAVIVRRARGIPTKLMSQVVVVVSFSFPSRFCRVEP